MRLFHTRPVKLSAASCLFSLALVAEPLPHWHRITLDRPEFASPAHIFHGIDIWERIQRHRDPAGPKEHGPHRFHEPECPDTAPAPAATPEPGYEWAMGLLLVSIGCTSRLRKK